MAGVSVPTGLMKPTATAGRSMAMACRTACPATRRVICSGRSMESMDSNKKEGKEGMIALGKKMSTALALAAVISGGSVVGAAQADIAGLSPCKESKAFQKREKTALKKLESSLKAYAPDSAPALAINASIEKTKKRFENYGKEGLLCGTDGLPHLIVNGDQAHWGEFITPGLLFLYVAGWIGWVGRSYLIAVRSEKKPTEKEIVLDVPLAARIFWRGFIWPLAASNEFLSGQLIEDDANITVSPR